MAKILIVDDDKLVLVMAGDMLREAGYDVVTLDTPFGVTGVARREKPDLVLLDVNMPAIQGDHVVDLIRKYEDLEGLKIYLFSDRPHDELDALVNECGADGFIVKSEMRSGLVSTVRDVLGAAPDANLQDLDKCKSKSPYKCCVLIVEGDAELRLRLVRLLEELQYCVNVVATAEEALTKASFNDYNMVISEATLPDKDGLDFYNLLVAAVPALDGKVLFLTDRPTTDFVFAVRKVRCNYISKPFVPLELMEVIGRIKEKSGISDRRHEDRYKWLGECTIEYGGESHARVLDLSKNGVHVRYGESGLLAGTEVEFKIKTLGISRHGCVIWSNAVDGDVEMGLEFEKEIPALYIDAFLEKGEGR